MTKTPQDLIQGTLRRPAPPLSGEHQKIAERIYAALHSHVATRALGHLYRDIDVVVDRREGLAIRPDIAFVLDGRESIVTEAIWGPPDMVLDITQPLTHSGKLEQRVAWFSVAGVSEYWLVEPELRGMAVLELAHGGVRKRTLFGDLMPVTSPLFPDLGLKPGELLR